MFMWGRRRRRRLRHSLTQTITSQALLKPALTSLLFCSLLFLLFLIKPSHEKIVFSLLFSLLSSILHFLSLFSFLCSVPTPCHWIRLNELTNFCFEHDHGNTQVEQSCTILTILYNIDNTALYYTVLCWYRPVF